MLKTNLHRSFQMDTKREEDGVWVDFGDGIKIRVRRAKSRKSLEVRRELDKPHSDQIRRGTISQEVAEDLVVKQIAFGIISDWSGIKETKDDGTEADVEYTGDKAYELLKALPELRDEILAITTERDIFRAKVDEDSEKNLPPTSPGVSSPSHDTLLGSAN